MTFQDWSGRRRWYVWCESHDDINYNVVKTSHEDITLKYHCNVSTASLGPLPTSWPREPLGLDSIFPGGTSTSNQRWNNVHHQISSTENESWACEYFNESKTTVVTTLRILVLWFLLDSRSTTILSYVFK